MTYYELVEKDFKNRGKIVPVTELSSEPKNHKAFLSLFGYGNQIKDWVDVNGTVTGYNKEFHLHALYFDIDNDKDGLTLTENLRQSQKQTQKLVKILYRKYDLHPDYLMIYFSGGKGFHIGVREEVFGGFEPSPNLPYQIKRLANYIAEDYVTLDTSIYKPNALFRMPDSKHGKTGMFKVPISIEELGGSIEEIMGIAEYPRPEFSGTMNLNDLVKNKKLLDLWERARHTSPEDNPDRRRLKDGGFFQPTTEERNNTYFKQAAMLMDKSIDPDDVLDIIKAINKASGDPLPDTEVYTLVNSAKRKVKSKPKKDIKPRSGDGLVSDMVPAYLDYLSPTNKKLDMLFDEFSKDTKQKLRGKFIGVFGKDGTKKSLYCQNVAYQNIVKNDARVIISNMEMGDNPLMGRLIDRALQNYRVRPSTDMEMEMEHGKESLVKQKLDLVAKHYSDKLIVNSNSSMTPDDYRALLTKYEEKYGKVDMLIVDGFSMMGGSSDRFQAQDDNSKGLKEVAKEFDVAIFAIFHANASCSKYERRPDRKVRGSDKQLDNIDIAVSLSLIIDTEKSKTITDLYYREDIGYALMYNKRGSGNLLRKIYRFNSERLALIGLDENPHEYEVNITNL